MTYFAAALVRTSDGWSAQELDLSEIEDLESLGDELRDLSDDDENPVLLLLEEDDEYLAVVRVDGGTSSLAEPRVFLSDERAVLASSVAAMLWEGEADEADKDVEADEDDEDDAGGSLGEPVGDAALLTDLGISAKDLLALCAEEGMLPADVMTELGDRAGFTDALDELRE